MRDRVFQIMKNDDTGEREVVQESQECVLCRHVEMVGGLIEQEDGSIL